MVQLYSSDLVASVSPSVRRLRAFQKINLEAGAQQEVTFILPVSKLAFVGTDNQWLVEAGEFKVTVGSEEATFSVTDTKKIGTKTNWTL